MSTTISAEPGTTVPPARQPAPPKGAKAPGPQVRDLGQITLRDAPGWLISLGVHVAIMVVLLLFKFNTRSNAESTYLNAIEDIAADTNFDATDVDQVGIGAEVTALSATSGVTVGGVGVTAGPSAQQETSDRVNDGFKGPEVTVNLGEKEMAMPAENFLTEKIGKGGEGVTGGGTENVAGEGGGGVASAIDRLAWELTQSLHESKTTVIWLFDQSLSLKERRDAIADRFENVYRQLESLDEGAKGSLMTVVATYGEGFKLLTERPVEDVKPLIPKVRAIPDDPSGKENVFAAVKQLAQKFKGERSKKRSVLIFIVTDEKGDDAEHMLEDTIFLCRKQGIKVYTVGNAALFGREKGYVTWKFPEGGTEDIEVDAGPETVEPEAIVLGFWGGNGADLSRMSSGYGPYALTRLCKETGGQYLIAQEDARGPRFDPAIMRSYQPDYRPIKEYLKSLEKNKAKAALVVAAKNSKVENIPIPRLGFPAYNDAVLKDTITEAQKPAADLDYKVNRFIEGLKLGEKDREKITEPRWRAAYDLAIGRSLAMHVRAFGYNQMLAEMKATPKTFQKKDSNEWRIEPSKTINAGQNIKKLEREAATYLKRVIDENPGTPWEKLAARELSTPMGWEWKELKNPGIFPANTSQEEARRQIRLAEEKAKAEAAKKPMTPQRDRPKL